MATKSKIMTAYRKWEATQPPDRPAPPVRHVFCRECGCALIDEDGAETDGAFVEGDPHYWICMDCLPDGF